MGKVKIKKSDTIFVNGRRVIASKTQHIKGQKTRGDHQTDEPKKVYLADIKLLVKKQIDQVEERENKALAEAPDSFSFYSAQVVALQSLLKKIKDI